MSLPAGVELHEPGGAGGREDGSPPGVVQRLQQGGDHLGHARLWGPLRQRHQDGHVLRQRRQTLRQVR